MNQQEIIEFDKTYTPTFITSIKPTSDYTRLGNKTSSQIFKLLQTQQDEYDIGFVKIAGSMGKQTAIVGSDYDLVIYLNNDEPPFDEAIECFKEVLEDNGFPVDKTTRFSIQLTARGIHFDLVLAQNFVCTETGKLAWWQKQYKRAFRMICSASNAQLIKWADKLYKGSLAQQTVEFIYRQPQIIKKTIVLAKYWDQEVNWDKYVCGRSSIIGLMVIHANTGKCPTTRISTCFRRFLEAMVELKNAYVIFEKHYDVDDVPEEILEGRRPIIMDPVSPYNNIGAGLSRRASWKFSSQARRT